MSGRVLIGIGLVCIVLGGVWTLQGIGVIGGGFMTRPGARPAFRVRGARPGGERARGGGPPAPPAVSPSPPPPRPRPRVGAPEQCA